MNSLIQTAQAVAQALSSMGAVFCFALDVSAADLNTLHVYVMPGRAEYRGLSRNSILETQEVKVVFLRKCGTDAMRAEMMNTAETAARGFYHRYIENSGTCSQVKYTPVYSPQALRERGIFSACAELVFSGIRDS